MTDSSEIRAARQRYPPIWVIYDHPRDFPDHFVVRIAWGLVKSPVAQLAPTLEAARRIAWKGGASFCLGRDSTDDPAIAESWI